MGSANECCVASEDYIWLNQDWIHILSLKYALKFCWRIFLPKYRGSALLSEAKKKVDALQAKIKEIEMQENVLMQKIHQRKEHKKLSIF